MLANLNPYQRLVAGIPLDGWILVDVDFDDGAFHALVTPAESHRVVVTDMMVSNFDVAAFARIEWAYRLNGIVTHVIPVSLSYEGHHLPLSTHWVLPVDAELGVQREAGAAHYCVSALGYFVTADITDRQEF